MPKHFPVILFREIRRDAFPDPCIEISAGRIKAEKKNPDQIEWTIRNHTSKIIEVAVVDFYADKGGTPFLSGYVPEPSGNIPAKDAAGKVGAGKIDKIKDSNGVVKNQIDTDGDVGTYKYTILARFIDPGPPTVTGPWFLVRDPELEID